MREYDWLLTPVLDFCPVKLTSHIHHYGKNRLAATLVKEGQFRFILHA